MEETRVTRRRPVWRKAQEWKSIVERFETSGETLEAFCLREQIPLKSLVRWRTKLRDGSTGSTRFVDLSSAIVTGSRVRAELDFGQGLVVRIFG